MSHKGREMQEITSRGRMKSRPDGISCLRVIGKSRIDLEKLQIGDCPYYPIQIDPQFDWAYDFHDGLALVNIGCKMNKDGFPEGGIMGYINHKGQYVINPQYKQAKDYSDGLAAVLVDKRWGFIDKQGSQQISMQFEDAESFKHGFARVMLNGKIGIINKAGKYVIDPIYNCLENFDRGLARFAFGKEWINWGYINSGGKIVWQRALKREQ